MGPKSVQDTFTKSRMLHILKTEQCIIYNPFSLTRLALNAINYKNVPDFWSPPCQECIIEVEQSCSYCLRKFPNTKLLAMHEAEHMSIELGVRIDDENLWDETREDADVRNKWLERLVHRKFELEWVFLIFFGGVFSFHEDEMEYDNLEQVSEEQNGDESVEDIGDLLIPVSASTTIKGEVELVDGIAVVNGVPLMDLPKDERRTLYQSITISGVKRKFCPLCRYTFKDNWAIESHYISNSCLYTCRYCGIR